MDYVDQSPILIVVDMQFGFDTARNPRTVMAAQEEIIKARESNQRIIFLEYALFQSTLKELTDLVNDYQFSYTIVKEEDDGSEEVYNFCKEHYLEPSSFVVCGVNVGACVISTVKGLSRRFYHPPIRVARRACNCFMNEPSFTAFEKIQNVIID